MRNCMRVYMCVCLCKGLSVWFNPHARLIFNVCVLLLRVSFTQVLATFRPECRKLTKQHGARGAGRGKKGSNNWEQEIGTERER